jgi:hypothetical protein
MVGARSTTGVVHRPYLVDPPEQRASLQVYTLCGIWVPPVTEWTFEPDIEPTCKKCLRKMAIDH